MRWQRARRRAGLPVAVHTTHTLQVEQRHRRDAAALAQVQLRQLLEVLADLRHRVVVHLGAVEAQVRELLHLWFVDAHMTTTATFSLWGACLGVAGGAPVPRSGGTHSDVSLQPPSSRERRRTRSGDVHTRTQAGRQSSLQSQQTEGTQASRTHVSSSRGPRPSRRAPTAARAP